MFLESSIERDFLPRITQIFTNEFRISRRTSDKKQACYLNFIAKKNIRNSECLLSENYFFLPNHYT